jgi:cytidylate kinase
VSVVIAIDGPAGAGKSSTSRHLAARLGFRHVDTGAMYRVVGVLARDRGIAADDDGALAGLVDGLEFTEIGDRVVAAGRDLTTAIREPDAGDWASRVSTRPLVRERLVALQRRLAGPPGVVMEGRDIGTVVFPDALVKVFLTADADERARRRAAEEGARGGTPHTAAMAEALRERDQRDSGRAASPLRPAADAVVIDSTTLSLEDVVARLEAVVRARLRGEGT